ncbi:MAG TPA: hypothetical protein VF992_02700 [Thermoplasmata archaeon]
MVARGDGVLISLVGFMALYVGGFYTVTRLLSGQSPGLVAPLLLVLGIAALVVAIVIYVAAGPPSWAPGGRPPWVSFACPGCGRPLHWVDELGQWYCTECQAYRGTMST